MGRTLGKFNKTVQERRRGADNKMLSQDIPIYRWFAVFIKCALELEGKTYNIHGKNHKLKFDRTHKWWKLIDLKSFPKTPKFIRFDNKLLPSQQSKLFDDYFWKKYRPLFQEKSTIIGEAINKSNVDDYYSIHFPKNYSLNAMKFDLLKFYKDKETNFGAHLKKGMSKKGDTSKYNAEIVLGDVGGYELLLKRLFNVLSIDQSETDLDNLHKYWYVQKRMIKNFKIPEITSRGSQDESSRVGTGGRRTTQTSRALYEYEIRTVQRDRRSAKILLINLTKGVFPKIDKVI